MTTKPIFPAFQGFEERSGRRQHTWGNGSGGADENFCGAFSDSFYQSGIDYEKLLSDIKNNLNGLKGFYFDYRNYMRSDVSAGSFTTSAMIPVTSYVRDDKPFSYTDEQGNTQAGLFRTGKLNRRICYVDEWNYGINLEGSRVVYSVILPYKDAKGLGIRSEPATPMDDFRREEQYEAIKLEVYDHKVFLGFIAGAFGQGYAKNVRSRMVEYFAYFLDKYGTDAGMLKNLYEQAPDFVLQGLLAQLGEKTLWAHLQLLTEYDDTGMLSVFKDSSSALINVLKAFGNAALLYNNFRKDPMLVKRIYKNLDNTSEYMGQTFSNRIIFSYLLNALCIANGYRDLTYTDQTFYYGGMYKLDADITRVFSKEKDDEFFLQQKKVIPLGGIDFLPFTEEIDEGPGAMYHPLDMVFLVDTETADQLPLPVPAIVIKALSDEEEWAEVNRAVRIGLDVLALVLGVITVATTGNPTVFALALIDIGLAGTDLVVQGLYEELSQIPEGREFIALWEKIYMVGGLITAGPLLIKGIMKAGTALWKTALAIKNIRVMNFIRACMTKVILEVNIANFSRNTVKELIYGEEALAQSGVHFSTAGITRLQEQGVLFVKGLDGQGRAVGYAVIYEGEVIAQGTAREVREALKDAWKAEKSALPGILRDLIPKWRFTHMPTSGAVINESTKRGTFLVGSFATDLKNILEELNYPEFDDIRQLKRGYDFPLPQAQKFNLLNVSNRVWRYFTEHGGFFTMVNSKWIDAAVQTGADIVIVSNRKQLYQIVTTDGVRVRNLTGFGKEIHRLEWKYGYRFDPETKMMLPPGKAKSMATLTRYNDYKMKN